MTTGIDNEGTTNAQTPTYECIDDNVDYELRRRSKNLEDEDDGGRAPSRLQEEDDDIEMRIETRSVSKMDITNLEQKIKVLEK
jgi:hypothetical protein